MSVSQQFYTWPPIQATTSSPSTGPNGSPIPLQSTLIGAEDPSTDLQPLKVDNSGNLLVSINASGLTPLPTSDAANGPVAPGTAASKSELVGAQYNSALPTLTDTQQAALQVDSNARLILAPLTNTSIVKAQLQDNAGAAIVLGQTVMASSLPVVIASDQSSLNINNIDGTVSLPTGAATEATLAKLPIAQDTALGTNSGPLMQGAVSTAAPTYTPGNINPLSLTPSGALRVDSSSSTQPISGTVTADQGAANATPWNENIAEFGGVAVSLGQKAMAASMPVTLSSDQPDIAVNLDKVGGAAVALGQAAMSASMPVTLASDQTDINTNLDKVGGAAITLGQKVMASSMPVTFASDQSGLPSPTGRSLANAPVYTDYSSINVTSGAYVQLVASTAATINMIEIFDSSGQAIYFAVGGSGSEVNQLIIVPGGNGQIPINIPSGSRISIKAVNTSATSGVNILNMYS